MNLKKNKTFILLILSLITFSFAACQSSADKKEDRTHFEPYIIKTEAEVIPAWAKVYVDEDMAYLPGESSIVRYDLTSGERTVLVEAEGNTAVCANKGYIYSYNKNQNAVLKYNSKGNIVKTYPLSMEPVDVNFIRAQDELLLIAALPTNSNKDTESVLYKLNMSDGSFSKIEDYKGKDGFSFIVGLDFIDKNTIIIISHANVNFINPIIKGYKYDLRNNSLLEEIIFPEGSSYCYNPEKECIYYYNIVGFGLDGSITSIREYYPETQIDMVVNSLNSNFIASLGIEDGLLDVSQILYSDGKVIIWSLLNNCFMVTDQSEKEHIKVLLTRNISYNTRFPYIASMFEAEYGLPVYISEYPDDIYMDKLRTKLLAADSDFDLILLQDPNKDNLLSSILKYELYEPLDSYEGITNNFAIMFDGIRSMMSHNGKLFGVPYHLAGNSWALRYDLRKYGFSTGSRQMTFDDIWKLCDGIINSGEKDVTVFERANIPEFISIFIQESLDREHLDQNVLADIFEKIKKYNAAGVLYDNSGEKKHLMDRGAVYFYSVLYDDIPAYPEFGTVMLTGNDKKNLWSMQGCAIINRYSKNKEMAADLLKYMTDSKFIYNTKIYQMTLLGSDLTKYDNYNEWSADKIAYLSDLNYLFKDSGIIRYDFGTISELIYTITAQLLDGSITPEKAAEEICDKIKYTYFE